MLNGKGHLRESKHSRYTHHEGRVVMSSPAQWCSSVQLLPVCIYMAPTSATWLIASEVRCLLQLKSRSMASGRRPHVHLNFLSYSLQQLRPCRHVLLSQKSWAPLRWSCKAYKLYGSAGLCSPGKSMFMRPKMIAPSWPKVVYPVADGKDVAGCGLSTGLFLASLFHDWRHSGPPLIANAAA